MNLKQGETYNVKVVNTGIVIPMKVHKQGLFWIVQVQFKGRPKEWLPRAYFKGDPYEVLDN